MVNTRRARGILSESGPRSGCRIPQVRNMRSSCSAIEAGRRSVTLLTAGREYLAVRKQRSVVILALEIHRRGRWHCGGPRLRWDVEDIHRGQSCSTTAASTNDHHLSGLGAVEHGRAFKVIEERYRGHACVLIESFVEEPTVFSRQTKNPAVGREVQVRIVSNAASGSRLHK